MKAIINPSAQPPLTATRTGARYPAGGRIRILLLPVLLCAAVICTTPQSEAAMLTNGNLTLVVRNDNGAIDDITLGGTNFFSHGTHVSDFGIQSGTDTTSFRVNTTDGAAGLLTTTTTPIVGQILVSGTYSVGVNVAFERAYTLVPGQNVIQISTRFVNLGSGPATLRYFETYDPDQGMPGTFNTTNDVYAVAGTPAARATAPGGASFILGGNAPGQTLASGGPFSITSGAALNGFFSAPADGNGASADLGTHIGQQFSLLASEQISLTHVLAFGATLANAEVALANAFDPPSVGSFRAGMNSNGGLGVENLSDSLSITTLTVTLFNDTFFDTAGTPPGVASTGWSQPGSTGGAAAALPANATTDGQTTATISFTSFDAADAINLGFDLDLFASPDGAGNPLGTQITATFSDGSSAIVTLGLNSTTINGFSYSYSGVSLPVPEPGTTALLALSGAGLLLLRRRRCR